MKGSLSLVLIFNQYFERIGDLIDLAETVNYRLLELGMPCSRLFKGCSGGLLQGLQLPAEVL
jgi:hypothetical protein